MYGIFELTPRGKQPVNLAKGVAASFATTGEALAYLVARYGNDIAMKSTDEATGIVTLVINSYGQPWRFAVETA